MTTAPGTAWTAVDHAHMARALRLARAGLWTTHPNPRVGCVLARGERVLGEGWHERAGEPHAEVHALRAAGGEARGATAYVTLEPCSHHGRTPPCADALIAAGVARVVAAMGDPCPAVAGAGFARLRQAGLVVATGLGERAARELNVGFVSRWERGRPWLRVKLAASLDGRTALPDGESRWISSEAARRDVQRWRARASCIVSGIGTVLRDDPRLDVRVAGAPTRRRYLLDTHLRLPRTARLLDLGPVTVLHAAGGAPPAWFAERGIEAIAVPAPGGRLDLGAVAAELGHRGETEAHVEAGATLAGALLAAGLVDELLLYLAPHVLGPGAGLFDLPALASMADRTSFTLTRADRVGPDLRLQLRPIACSPESSRPSASSVSSVPSAATYA